MKQTRRRHRGRRRARRRVLRARAGRGRGRRHPARAGDRGLPAGERRARQLRPAGAQRRHAPGRARRPRPGAALDARQLQPLLHRAAAEPGAGALALAVPGRLHGGAGGGGRSRAARAARGERAPARRARRRTRRALALPPRRRAAGVRDGGRPAAAARGRRAARALGARVDEVDGRGGAAGSSPACAASWPAPSSSPRTATWTRCCFTRAVAGLAEEAGAAVAPAPRCSRSSRRAAACASLTTRGDVRGRPGRAGGRRLDAVPHPRARACGCRSSRPRATASTWSGRRTSPSCRCTWATPTSCSRHWATPAPREHARAVRLGHAHPPQARGAPARGRPARHRPAGRRPGAQLWRGPRPVTPDGLPVIGRVPRPRAGHPRDRPLHARPLARAR